MRRASAITFDSILSPASVHKQTNQHSGTRVDEIGDGIYRINTPVEIPGGALSFNQYLVVDEVPLLFHYLFEETTRTLFCGDLFTQPGRGDLALTEGDILGPSEAFRGAMDYYSATKNIRALIAKVAATRPTTLACMHGSAWRGDGEAMLNALGNALDS